MFIEPLFEHITKEKSKSNNKPVSTKNITIEPLFSKVRVIDSVVEKNCLSLSTCVESNDERVSGWNITNVVDNSDVIGRNVIGLDDADSSDVIRNDVAVQNKAVGVENSSQNPITNNEVYNVTVYPQELKSYSQCLYFTS